MKTTAFAMLLLAFGSTAATADIVTFGSGGNQFTMEFVPIGNPGNAADTTGDPNPAGSVAYTYRMGKFEVSRDMVTKANSAGGLGIPLADLTAYGGNGVNRPATGVSWNEAARFVNWLNASTGSPLAYKFSLQPGQGGYDSNANIQLWTPSDAGYNPNNLFRNSLATYFLPSVHEWYKAAYYNPATSQYFDYPTGSDTAPTAVTSGTAAGTAVYFQTGVFQSGPTDITLAGGLSPYGTMGQGGNATEWQETEFDLVNNSSSSARGIRGGEWGDFPNGLLSATWVSGNPLIDNNGSIGFRVASVPEASPMLYGGVVTLGLLCWRRFAG